MTYSPFITTEVLKQTTGTGSGQAVSDANANLSVNDSFVVYETLTSTRVVNLPAVATMDERIVVFVKDESGNCSDTVRIQIVPNGVETIDGAGSVEIQVPYGMITIYATSAGWHSKRTGTTFNNTTDEALGESGTILTVDGGNA